MESNILVACGLLGALLACGAYLWLHSERISLKTYAWLNLASAALGGASLVVQFNLGTLCVETFFGIVSAWALFKGDPSYAD